MERKSENAGGQSIWPRDVERTGYLLLAHGGPFEGHLAEDGLQGQLNNPPFHEPGKSGRPIVLCTSVGAFVGTTQLGEWVERIGA